MQLRTLAALVALTASCHRSPALSTTAPSPPAISGCYRISVRTDSTGVLYASGAGGTLWHTARATDSSETVVFLDTIPAYRHYVDGVPVDKFLFRVATRSPNWLASANWRLVSDTIVIELGVPGLFDHQLRLPVAQNLLGSYTWESADFRKAWGSVSAARTSDCER